MKVTQSPFLFLLPILFLFPPQGLRADMKLKTRTSVAGHPMDSTVYIKGARQRSETTMPMGTMVIVYQCDQKRMLQVNEQANTCMITPLEEEAEAPSATPQPPAGAPRNKDQRGGVVTVTATATDTGERKPMLGYSARHIKTSMSYVAGPGACNPGSMSAEMDGWYDDFHAEALKCAGERSAFRGMQRGACQDRVRFKSAGAANTGYPLQLTTTLHTADGHTMTTSLETLELSSATLDASLFAMPAGCRVVSSYQELMGAPDIASLMRPGRRQREVEAPAQTAPAPAPSSSGARATAAGILRIGIVKFNNKAAEEVSTDSLRSRLIEDFTLMRVEAVPLQAQTPEEVEAEAREKGCEYVLYTDIADLKAGAGGGKLGGILGRATGQQARQKFQADLEFKLFLTGEDEPRLESSAHSKEGAGAEESVANALRQETREVMDQVRKDAEERKLEPPPK